MNGAARHLITAWELMIVVVLVIVGAGFSYLVYSTQRNNALNKVAVSDLSSAISATREVYYQSGASNRSFSYVSEQHLEAADGYLRWTTGTSSYPSVVSYYVPSWPSKAHPEALYIALRSATGLCFFAVQVASRTTYYLPASHKSFPMGTWHSSYNGRTCQAFMLTSTSLSWSK